MPAFARVAIPGIAYHVTQRGNYRQDIFATEGDRETYLGYAASAALSYGLELHGWCLTTNHVHWIVLPKHEVSMAQSFRRAHSRYASYVNAGRNVLLAICGRVATIRARWMRNTSLPRCDM